MLFKKVNGRMVQLEGDELLEAAKERKGDMVSEQLATVESLKVLRAKRKEAFIRSCLLYTSPSPRDKRQSRMPSSA